MTQRTINLSLTYEQITWLLRGLTHPSNDTEAIEWIINALEGLRYQLDYSEIRETQND